ncbi:virulence plasmid 28 protein [Pseudomonas sp. PDM03]|uniref:Tc toxin subunit A n=1 Tax=Pseudomonas sp. PDM03 TaxID=2769266 RepID=UPI0017873359|nr:Tc toxin subunit A [Pseudomonas sp. PDM03]MBD9587280.1 virulence plasmid 28 protein [Pseudomonas sp. PDM03]
MTKDTRSNSLLSQLFDSTIGRERMEILTQGQHLLEEDGSVLQLVRMGQQGLIDTFGLSSHEARLVQDKANSVLVHVARQFRNHRLTRHTPRNALHYTGINALVDGPDYEKLFNPAWGETTPVGSLDANDSPAAYFVELYTKALELEARTDADASKKLAMKDRRPDLATRVIDPQMAYQMTPTVVLVNEVLGQIIESQPFAPPRANDEVVDDRLLQARYPMTTLPFEWYREQWNHVLQQQGLSLGDVVRIADPKFPYWKETGAHGGRSSIAMRQASGLGPAMQALLLEERYVMSTVGIEEAKTPRVDYRTGRIDPDPQATNDDFFKVNFGATYDDLLDVVKFCIQASINSDQLASLLSIERYAPHVSPNVIPPPTVDAKTFGSVFINAEGTGPAISVAQPKGAQTDRKLENATKRHFDLINRMLRLARQINLPYDQCDLLLVAAARAQTRKSANEPLAKASASPSYKITDSTLRAIGLFQDFRREFRCSAEDFAALIDEMSVCARGEEQSQFDRVFNSQSLFDTPLRLDGDKFAIHPQTDSDRRTVDQICSGLGINLETWRYLARVVAECYGMRNELERSVRVVSSFYRLVRLASFCGVTSIELAALLETMSPMGSDWLRELLGHPHIGSYRTIGRADVLDVLHAVQSCVKWCRENNLEVIWLVQHVSPVEVPTAASEAELTLLQELRKRLEPTRLTEDALLGAGIPPVRAALGTDWLTLLSEIVEEKGLIVKGRAVDDASYESWAKDEINGAVEMAEVDETQAERVRATILAIVLQTRAAQSAVVQESLAVYLNVEQDQALVVLRWVESDGVYLLLNETMRVLGDVTQTEQTIAVGDDILKMLAHLVRRTAVVKKLALSSAMLATLTTQEHWRWFGLRQIEELTLDTFYLLTIYGRAVIHTEEPAEKLLAYLKLVNELPPQLTPEDIRLIRDGAASALAQAVKWGIKEVLECATYLAPDLPLIREMSQIDFVIRARGCAATTGLDAKAILDLGMLSPESDVQSCRQAAEHAVQCLSESAIQSKALEFGEVGQSVTGTTTVSTNRLIASAPGEYARIEVTLRDFQGEPLANITVTWECERCGLQDLTSVTDHAGRASVRFKAGNWMGLAKVVARYGLGQRVYAEPVLIDCDEDSIDYVIADTSVPPFEPKLAGNLEYLELQVRLDDKFGNFAADRPVQWGCTGGNLDPVVSYTDKDGFARTRLRCREAVADLTATARYEGKDVLKFEKISFVDRPRIAVLEVLSPAVVGLPLELSCLVIGLDGRPFEGATVTFYQGETSLGTDDSDENGEATLTVPSVVAGPLTVRASVTHGSKSLELEVASAAVLHGQSADYLLPVAGSDRPSQLWIEVREATDNDASPIARYAIEWTVESPDDEPPEKTVVLTNSDGRSTFPFLAAKAGLYKVTALMQGGTDKRVFDLEVVEPLQWLIKLIDLTDETAPVEHIIEPGGFLNLSRNRKYRLELAPETTHDLTGARAVLGWSAPFSAKAMGMTFAPLTGEYTIVSGGTMSWSIDCANLRDGSFELTWLCNRIDQTLVLKGYLSPGAPVVQHPLPATQVEPRMVVGGTGAKGSVVQIFIGKGLPYRAQTQVDDQGRWSVQLSQPQAEGPCTLSIKLLAAAGAEYWAPDVTVTVKEDYFAPPHIHSPCTGAKVAANPVFSGFGRPGATVTLVKGHEASLVYGDAVVGQNGGWELHSSKMEVPQNYLLNANLSVGGGTSPYLPSDYYVEVVASATNKKYP